MVSRLRSFSAIYAALYNIQRQEPEIPPKSSAGWCGTTSSRFRRYPSQSEQLMTTDGVLHPRYAMNSEDHNQNDRKTVVTTATINGGIFTILVLPNHGGISGQLTKATRGNRTAGQTVRLPHTEEKQT
jgi:hypothetical protein